jgi:hypothetical protein
LGNLGKVDEAVVLAQKSFDTYPTHESAREAAKWLAKAGKGVSRLAGMRMLSWLR